VFNSRWRRSWHWQHFLLLLSSTLLCHFLSPANATTASPAEPQTVYYAGQPRQDYFVELLQLALSNGCAPHYQLQASGLDLPKQRAFDLMNAHQGIDVLYGSASVERITAYRAVTFPILRGLMGLRIALVSAAAPDILKQAHSITALSQLRAGQFMAWSDTAVLRANGFNVEAAGAVESLYQMLSKGRVDYFPRSILEIRQNLDEHADLNLQIDPYILLYYPTATYFYVARDNTALADALLCGLEQAQRDGSLNQLFERHYADVLQQLNVSGRRLIKLHNPLLPAGVPLLRPELWYPLPNNTKPAH
jgi:hypothetical protein